MADPAAVHPGNALQLVQLSQLIDNIAEAAYKGLQGLSTTLPALSDEERYCCVVICESSYLRCEILNCIRATYLCAYRKHALLLHLHSTRQRLLRLHVLIEWSNKVSNVTAYAFKAKSQHESAQYMCTSAEILCSIPDICCSVRLQPCQLTHILDCQAAATKEVGKILARTQSHADALRESADQLYYLNQELQSCCVPALDVHTARQVLETGTDCSGHYLCKISPSAVRISCCIQCSESCMCNSCPQCRSMHFCFTSCKMPSLLWHSLSHAPYSLLYSPSPHHHITMSSCFTRCEAILFSHRKLSGAALCNQRCLWASKTHSTAAPDCPAPHGLPPP